MSFFGFQPFWLHYDLRSWMGLRNIIIWHFLVVRMGVKLFPAFYILDRGKLLFAYSQGGLNLFLVRELWLQQ